MNTKLSLSIILTIGAFVLSLYLFVVAVIAYDDMTATEYPGCGTTNFDTPIRKEVAVGHPGEVIFKNNCKACHAIDRRIIGPALGGVLERRDSLWVIGMIRNSSKMIASGDPQAVALFKEFNETQMTSFTSFSDEELRSLLEYLRLASNYEPLPVPSPAVVASR